MASRYSNAVEMIRLVEYYKVLIKLLGISRSMTTIAWKIINHIVSREWGEKRIQSLARDAMNMYAEDLWYNKGSYFPIEEEYPMREKAIERLETLQEYFRDILNGKVSFSDIYAKREGEVLEDMRMEVLGLIEDRVSPKEYVEPLRVVKQMKELE